jgi:hypothetical protein
MVLEGKEMLRNILTFKGEKSTGFGRKSHNEALHNLYSSDIHRTSK